jgi:AcrR family transcriptional regulator
MTALVKVESGAMARHIATVAARLFAARGYDATSVREIVEAAGVTKPTLYYHFGSKEGLAQALLTVPMTRLVAKTRGLLEEPGGDAVGAVAAMIETQFAFCREDPDRARFVYAGFFGPLGSGLSAELARFGADLTELWSGASARLVGDGWIEPARSEACAASLRGLIAVYTMDYLYRGVELGPGLGRSLVDDLLRGFGTRERC